jgi:hypothetical protein
MKSILRLCSMFASCVLLACGSSSHSNDNDPPDAGQNCDAKTVYARPTAGTDCQQFASPCEIPAGYVQCCGGFAYGACVTQNLRCVDDTSDTCNPDRSSTCPGICQP